MKTLIQDKSTNEFYAVACASNPKGYLTNANDKGNPDEDDFPYWTSDENEAFDFGSELSAKNEINMCDLTCDGLRTSVIINK